MDWDQIEGNWKQLEAQVKQRWRKLTDEDVARIHGRRDRLLGKIQERYGLDREVTERQIEAFRERL